MISFMRFIWLMIVIIPSLPKLIEQGEYENNHEGKNNSFQ
jgi:hypothetical protein